MQNIKIKQDTLSQVENIAKIASERILEIYHNHDPQVKYKKDNSPVTEADIASHEIIVQKLQEISSISILSEECILPYESRKSNEYIWLVDPLDGTKDFLAKNNQFTVNIALIENSKPVLGVVYIPAEGLMYSAQKGLGAYKNNHQIFNNSKRTNLIGSDSNFHSTEETQNFYKKFNVNDIKRYGSALKFCKLAEGEIDLYARLNGTMEWDTAAGQVIMNEAGCKIVDMVTKQEIIYNKENLVNNYFIASRNDLEFVSDVAVQL